eukprot:CAMPEP_0194503766 /NCGR_PEP_ID=MMETSP0253-20130528/28562_1 /TAXON_ID=2966 /ORGANISM="Noctiluca scintillans" /LENGTH=739 /DNA_ID=CAMNT_0039346081 /DNA_START=99 /DNA_END=2318 /DNA_ORIENTATION=+
MKGISYGPAPLKDTTNVKLPHDDFFSDGAKLMWHSSGRGDLAIMKKLGANAVRIYGNHIEKDHSEFLMHADDLGLGVIAGMSDYPFTQMDGNCMTTQYNCYEQVKESYLGNLRGGFLNEQNRYHQSLRSFIILNEPDLKVPGVQEPLSVAKSLISAFDGILDAEREMGVVEPTLNFTVTMSFAVCTKCSSFTTKPALGMMDEFKRAMLDPESVGYKANNDLRAAFFNRFENSFNTANPANDMNPLFLDDYKTHFQGTPVYIGEYHKPSIPKNNRVLCPSANRCQLDDLKAILRIAESDEVLAGISFFEWQVRYDKGGSEMDFGMFGLGDYSFGEFFLEPDRGFPAWCLSPATEIGSNEILGDSVADAYGGERLDMASLCTPNPQTVSVDEDGFNHIARQQHLDSMAAFVQRAVERSGGIVRDVNGLKVFASKYSNSDLSVRRLQAGWSQLKWALADQPSFASWDPNARCVANRDIDPGLLGQHIGYVCGVLEYPFTCANIPTQCQIVDASIVTKTRTTWLMTDYIFSLYYQQAGGIPLDSCNFGGTAVLLHPSLLPKATKQSECVVSREPRSTVLGPAGYEEIKQIPDPGYMMEYMTRVSSEVLDRGIQDVRKLQDLATHPPRDYEGMLAALRNADWVGGSGVTTSWGERMTTSIESSQPAPAPAPTPAVGPIGPSPASTSSNVQGGGGLIMIFFLIVVIICGVVAVGGLLTGGYFVQSPGKVAPTRNATDGVELGSRT